MVLNVYRFDYTKQKEFGWLLASDLHDDDMFFDNELFQKQFDEAVSKGYRILLNGDVLSMYLPKDIKRYTSGQDKVTGVDAKMNLIVGRVYERLTPYVEYIDEIGTGNHEVSILKYHSFDATLQLIGRLNGIRKNPQPIKHGGYTGWIRFIFNRGGGRSGTAHYDIFRDHGKGGSAEVTRGMIDLQRLQHKHADLIWLAHKHQVISTLLERNEGIASSNRIYSRLKRGLITGCYKKPLKTYENHKVKTEAGMEKYDINKHGYIVDYGETKMRVGEHSGGHSLESY
jgi:hypothetical protein